MQEETAKKSAAHSDNENEACVLLESAEVKNMEQRMKII